MSCTLHLHTLSGEHHPLTAVPQITRVVAGLDADFSFLIQICGSHLAILFYDQLNASSQNSFVVWNWRTGHQQIVSNLSPVTCFTIDFFCNQYIHTSEFQSFAFMTEDLILAAILRSDMEPTLQVLRVSAAYLNPVRSVADIPFVCELQYPELQGNLEYFLIRAEPTPTWRPPADLKVPFYSSRKEFIFTISTRIISGDTHESTVLFVPLSTLLLEVERSHAVHRRVVSWRAWGPSGTRMMCREPSETWVCYTYGMKFILGLRWKNGHVARVYDFNRHAARKYVRTSLDSPVPWMRLAKETKPGGRYEGFCPKVVTTLPGRVATITLEHSDDGWDAAMIGEDHIVMVQVRYLLSNIVIDLIADLFRRAQPNSSMYGYMAM